MNAMLALWRLVLKHGRVHVTASDRDQARRIFESAKTIVMTNAYDLQKDITPQWRKIRRP